MNTQTIRSISLSALAATATLAFTLLSVPTQANNGLCLQRGMFPAQVYAPRVEGRMVQLGVPGRPSIVFDTRS